MKIGIDIRTLMDAQYSGVSGYTYSLVKQIFERDPVSQYRLFYNSAKKVKHLPDFNYANCQTKKLNYPNKIFNYLLQKTLRFPKIDSLLGADLFFMPHMNFISLSGSAGLILTIHDLSFLRYPDFFSRRKNFWHYLLNLKKLLARSDKIVAVSQNTKNDLLELCDLPEDKIEVIYSGLDYGFRPIERTEKKLIGVKDKYDLSEKFIFFLGNLEPRKNLEGLIGAFNRLNDSNKNFSDWDLVIAGGSGWKEKSIRSAWQRSKNRDKIKFIGYVDAADKPYLYNLASLFVYPSFYEGFGFPPLEAMACGLPVITSFNSSLPEVVGDAALMIDPFNINEIAEAMEKMLTDNELAAIYRQRGLVRVKKFNWADTADRYIKLFKEAGGK